PISQDRCPRARQSPYARRCGRTVRALSGVIEPSHRVIEPHIRVTRCWHGNQMALQSVNVSRQRLNGSPHPWTAYGTRYGGIGFLARRRGAGVWSSFRGIGGSLRRVGTRILSNCLFVALSSAKPRSFALAAQFAPNASPKHSITG